MNATRKREIADLSETSLPAQRHFFQKKTGNVHGAVALGAIVAKDWTVSSTTAAVCLTSCFARSLRFLSKARCKSVMCYLLRFSCRRPWAKKSKAPRSNPSCSSRLRDQ